jgi:D-arabinose 1-dehydrogenase-like Zn-dependent alcohol dehydrogenase
MVVSKFVKKATVELIKQDNPLCASLQIVSPPGRVLLVTVPARKDVTEILEIFDNTTVHSLALRDQQRVEEEMMIIKKKGVKGGNPFLSHNPNPNPNPNRNPIP